MSEHELIRRLEKIEKAIDRIERKISILMQEKKKVQWVRASVITKITGWNNAKMYQARQNGYVQYEERQDGFWYNPDSIHPIHIKSNSG